MDSYIYAKKIQHEEVNNKEHTLGNFLNYQNNDHDDHYDHNDKNDNYHSYDDHNYNDYNSYDDNCYDSSKNSDNDSKNSDDNNSKLSDNMNEGLIFGYNDIDIILKNDTIKNCVQSEQNNNIISYSVELEQNDKKSYNDYYQSEYNKNVFIDNILNENEKTKYEKLELEGCYITELPERFSTFYWLKELIIIQTKIEYIKHLPLNLTSLIIRNNTIKILDGSLIPDSVKYLKWSNNSTINIIKLKEGIETLNLTYNDFTEINCPIPSSVMELNLSDNKLIILPQFIKTNNSIDDSYYNIYDLDISKTSITCIDELPDSIYKLSTCYCKIFEINKFPENLTIWKSFKSKVSKILCNFPQKLKDIDLYDSHLIFCPELPISIKTVDLAKNLLDNIPIFPMSIQQIDITDNTSIHDDEIKELKKILPDTILFLTGNMENINSFQNKSYENFFDNFIFQNNRRNIQFDFESHTSEYTENNPHYILLGKIWNLK